MFDNLKTLLFTAVPTSPALFLAIESPSKASVLATIILPILFFAVGKSVDVCLQIHFRRQEAGRRKDQLNHASNIKIHEENNEKNL